jgi:hypothetical protein
MSMVANKGFKSEDNSETIDESWCDYFVFMNNCNEAGTEILNWNGNVIEKASVHGLTGFQAAKQLAYLDECTTTAAPTTAAPTTPDPNATTPAPTTPDPNATTPAPTTPDPNATTPTPTTYPPTLPPGTGCGASVDYLGTGLHMYCGQICETDSGGSMLSPPPIGTFVEFCGDGFSALSDAQIMVPGLALSITSGSWTVIVTDITRVATTCDTSNAWTALGCTSGFPASCLPCAPTTTTTTADPQAPNGYTVTCCSGETLSICGAGFFVFDPQQQMSIGEYWHVDDSYTGATGYQDVCVEVATPYFNETGNYMDWQPSSSYQESGCVSCQAIHRGIKGHKPPLLVEDDDITFGY